MPAINNEDSSWTLLFPILGLQLTSDINFEYSSGRVTFVSGSVLPRRRKRLGLPMRVSELKVAHLPDFFDQTETFAIVRWTGKPKEFENLALRCLREEIALLSLSQLGYAKRYRNSAPSVMGEREFGKGNRLIVDNVEKGRWMQNFGYFGKPAPLVLDKRWHDFQKDVFHRNLMRIIRKEVKVDKGWRRDLYNAALLVGQSQISLDLPQAFLWNVIAIELLLTQQGDKYTEALPTRAEAFLGWADNWSTAGYAERIRDIYRKRSAFVHAGRRELIDFEDLFFTDDLVLNLFNNIAAHPDLFSSKKKVLDFASRVAAEHVLGVKPKVRPKTLSFISRRYTERDRRMY